MRPPGGHDAVVDYLLAEGANINAASPNGTTGADDGGARRPRDRRSTLLIANGADVNARNQNGATALAWAQRGNEQAMAAALQARRREGIADVTA